MSLALLSISANGRNGPISAQMIMMAIVIGTARIIEGPEFTYIGNDMGDQGFWDV